MRLAEACSRLFSFRRVLILVTVSFTLASLSTLYNVAPVRSKLQYIQQSVQSMHTTLVDIKTSRSNRPTLDIVISMYREDATAVARQIQELVALDPVRGLDVNTIIYVKDSEANLTAVQELTNASSVIYLSNLGREGGTFLTHIVMNWKYLARHTMFIQAAMHEFDSAKGRIADYFIATTGVLPLGSLEVCECLSCKDPWDASRTYPRLPQLYSALNSRMCPKLITLSYLGQILVSAQRIQSRPRKIYKHLRAVLESDAQHFIHEDPRQEWQFGDDPSEPYFGHTMERSWMLVWGCEDIKIANSCGSWDGLLNRRLEGDEDDKCQCLDKRGREDWF